MPKAKQYYCFICSSKVEKIDETYMQCVSEDCGEVFHWISNNKEGIKMRQIKTPFSNN